MLDKTQTIRSLNDRFRKGDTTVPGQVVVTRGLIDLLEECQSPPEDLMHKVRDFDAFTCENDPHREHDFGSFDFQGYPCFWKLDYYSPDLKWGSDDPSDPKKTCRVLTVMLAEEY